MYLPPHIIDKILLYNSHPVADIMRNVIVWYEKQTLIEPQRLRLFRHNKLRPCIDFWYFPNCFWSRVITNNVNEMRYKWEQTRLERNRIKRQKFVNENLYKGMKPAPLVTFW